MKRIRRKKCRNCGDLFTADKRVGQKQKYCSKEACKKASKKASQQKWLSKPPNKDYFRSPENTARVQEWRKRNPGYWRRVSKRVQPLQDKRSTQEPEMTKESASYNSTALQDLKEAQVPILLGLIAHLTGKPLQEEIENTIRRLVELGSDIIGGNNDSKTNSLSEPSSECPQAIWLGGS